MKVKICGITNADGVFAAIRSGADAIGLNVVAGTPRELALDEAAALARLARSAGAAGERPLVVAITADASHETMERILAEVDPDVVQLSGDEPIEAARQIGRRTWKVLHLPASEPTNLPTVARDLVRRTEVYLAGGVERVFLDTAGGPHPGGTGTRAAGRLAAAVAREVPITLAGGLDPANVAGALRDIPAVGVDVASGVESSPGVKDEAKIAAFCTAALQAFAAESVS